MSNVVIKGIIPGDGNPEGLVIAPKGALFYKSNSIYKINYIGMISSSWQNVSFDSFGKSSVFITSEDIAILPVSATGSYLYIKETGVSYIGWKLLSNKETFIAPYPSATPTVTPTPTPTATATVTVTPTVTPSATTTITPSATPTITPTITPTVTTS